MEANLEQPLLPSIAFEQANQICYSYLKPASDNSRPPIGESVVIISLLQPQGCSEVFNVVKDTAKASCPLCAICHVLLLACFLFYFDLVSYPSVFFPTLCFPFLFSLPFFVVSWFLSPVSRQPLIVFTSGLLPFCINSHFSLCPCWIIVVCFMVFLSFFFSVLVTVSFCTCLVRFFLCKSPILFC